MLIVERGKIKSVDFLLGLFLKLLVKWGCKNFKYSFKLNAFNFCAFKFKKAQKFLVILLMFFIILYLLSNILKGLLVKVGENFFNFNFKCWYCFLMFKFSLEVFKIKVRILVRLICFKKLIFKFFF